MSHKGTKEGFDGKVQLTWLCWVPVIAVEGAGTVHCEVRPAAALLLLIRGRDMTYTPIY